MPDAHRVRAWGRPVITVELLERMKADRPSPDCCIICLESIPNRGKRLLCRDPLCLEAYHRIHRRELWRALHPDSRRLDKP